MKKSVIYTRFWIFAYHFSDNVTNILKNSCGFDATIFVWDSKTHECLRVLKGIHQDSIYCMAYVGYDEVWSGSCNSRDGSICVWSVNGLNAVLKPL